MTASPTWGLGARRERREELVDLHHGVGDQGIVDVNGGLVGGQALGADRVGQEGDLVSVLGRVPPGGLTSQVGGPHPGDDELLGAESSRCCGRSVSNTFVPLRGLRITSLSAGCRSG
jgi:hypothetical protein